MNFIDAFSGYNQICMSTTDEENITFVIDYGLHCYRVMPFGLKNVDATYQMFVNKLFKPLINKTMEVYVDDMTTKSVQLINHVVDLRETFEVLFR